MSDPTSMDDVPLWRAIKEPEWRAVLASNAALARTDNEDVLLTEICESAVAADGYLLAWYGRVVRNGDFQISAIASSAGTARDYLDDLRLTWESHAAGFPQAELANGSSTTFVTNDIAADERFTWDLFRPWRDKARLYGINSLAAVPVFASGGVDGFLTVYSVSTNAFDATAVSILETLCQHIGLGMDKYRASARVNDALEGTIRVLTRALEARDPYTAGHQAAVAALAEQIAIRLGLDDDKVQGIRLAALIHDIGKIGVPTELLIKPGKLRPAEMDLIKEHVAIGEEVLSTIDFPWPIADMVGQHHERCDGSGYPRGLLGADTLLGSRIIAVADVAEAMSRDRPYRASLGLQATVDFLQAGRGTQFDRDVVKAAVALIENGSFTL
jgi:putative nucleotidyltransferase with HDIG domain